MGTLAQNFLDSLQSTLDVEMQRLEGVLADEVDTRGITDRGALRKRFDSQTARSGATIIGQITGVSYANYVAEGTPAGYWPPKPPIKSWVQSKLNIPPQLEDNVTFLIRAKIFQEGTPTRKSPQRGRNDFVRAALLRRMPVIADSLEEASSQALE